MEQSHSRIDHFLDAATSALRQYNGPGASSNHQRVFNVATERLMKETVTPVCSARYQARLGRSTLVADDRLGQDRHFHALAAQELKEEIARPVSASFFTIRPQQELRTTRPPVVLPCTRQSTTAA